MSKKHWQSFGELNNSDAYKQSVKDEFREDLPVETADNGFLEGKTPRRDFLKYLGFSTAAAAVAASCEMPVKKAIPFANKPEDIVPGIANYYATTFVQDGDAVSVIAKVRDGRPIKIEGNDLSPITNGGTSARVQASVLDLYDTARLRFPLIDGKEVKLEDIDKAVSADLASANNVVVLTSTVVSPSSKEVIAQFLAKHAGSKHITFDAISYSGILQANEATYGKRTIPSYRFDKAKTIVSIGADFLGTWLSPIEFAKQYAVGKRIDEKKPEMSKHFHFETVASLTGSNADERILHRPSETGALVAGLLEAINGQAVSGVDDKLKKGIEKVAKALVATKGASLVVAGSNDVNVQILVNAINETLQSNGNTIDWSATYNTRQGIDADMVKLVADMKAGAVGALIIYGANPVYTYFNSKEFVDALKKVKVTVSFNTKADETTQLCKYVIPDHNYLESWGDAEVKTGYYSFVQPTIYPLFKTRQWQDSLLKWSGATTDYLAFLKSYWSAKVGGETGWDKVLQDGVINPTVAIASTVSFNAAAVAGANTAVSSYKKSDKIELVLYQKVAIGEGQGASNPWLQELPDPVSKATWDNYLIISPALAKSLLKIDLAVGGQADAYEVQPPKHVVEITAANGVKVSLPALIIPGTHQNTVGIAVGYGRTEKLGKGVLADEGGKGMGANAFPFASLVNGTVSYSVADITLKDTGDLYKVALTQTHNIYNTSQGNRTEVMKELTLAEFKHNPNEILEDRDKELKPYGGIANFEKEGTIYPTYDRPGLKWGMSVDLNTCNGCGACVVACNAENNIPVVGKIQVAKAHEMHWLRIDRYYTGDPENPSVVFQPLMCQHCDNAPCENVCPVAATNHSSEGLNQMTYNRCIGTRYCANNCPYKVRRFNWLDYTGADSFADNQKPLVEEGGLNEVVLDMNDDLTRMVLNPDVTVRARGVIEKCSFCVQRLQAGKLSAKKDSRVPEDKDFKVACQQACPTNAIVFGNANSAKSEITTVRKANEKRLFLSLEQLHVLPNVTYMAKVRHIEGEDEDKKEAPKAEYEG
jgi:molybdopterin-containing oxidoreductase family iron-sulfur binding subunit